MAAYQRPPQHSLQNDAAGVGEEGGAAFVAGGAGRGARRRSCGPHAALHDSAAGMANSAPRTLLRTKPGRDPAVRFTITQLYTDALLATDRTSAVR